MINDVTWFTLLTVSVLSTYKSDSSSFVLFSCSQQPVLSSFCFSMLSSAPPSLLPAAAFHHLVTPFVAVVSSPDFVLFVCLHLVSRLLLHLLADTFIRLPNNPNPAIPPDTRPDIQLLKIFLSKKIEKLEYRSPQLLTFFWIDSIDLSTNSGL